MTRAASCIVIVALAFGCTPEYPLCRSESNCRLAEKCVGGKCVRCAGDEDCLEGERCAEGVCEPRIERCAGSADCAGGTVCILELCAHCFEDGQCGAGRVCEDGACVECRKDADCGKGGQCKDGACSSPAENEQVPVAAEADCVLEPVYFEFDSVELTKEARKTLEEWFLCLMPKRTYTLIGRADSAGDEGYNLTLGLARARAVKGWLVGQGYPGGGLVVTTAGKDGASSEDGAKDRRVDIL